MPTKACPFVGFEARELRQHKVHRPKVKRRSLYLAPPMCPDANGTSQSITTATHRDHHHYQQQLEHRIFTYLAARPTTRSTLPGCRRFIMRARWLLSSTVVCSVNSQRLRHPFILPSRVGVMMASSTHSRLPPLTPSFLCSLPALFIPGFVHSRLPLFTPGFLCSLPAFSVHSRPPPLTPGCFCALLPSSARSRLPISSTAPCMRLPELCEAGRGRRTDSESRG